MIQSSKLTVPLFVALLLAILAAGCAPAPTPPPTAVPPSPTALVLPTAAPATAALPTTAPTAAAPSSASPELTGAALYQMSCAACHGADRAGNTLTLNAQTISPPSLQWNDLTTTYQTQPSRGSVEQQVAISITKGQDETGADLNAMMPRWSSLSQAQVDSLVQYLKTAETTSGAAPTLTPEAMSLKGQQLYQTACAACHGADGAGLTFVKDGNTIATPSLQWSVLSQLYTADPSRGTAAQQLALSITKGQDETGGDLSTMMPRWSSLSQEQVDSLVQYLQTAFK